MMLELGLRGEQLPGAGQSHGPSVEPESELEELSFPAFLELYARHCGLARVADGVDTSTYTDSLQRKPIWIPTTSGFWIQVVLIHNGLSEFENLKLKYLYLSCFSPNNIFTLIDLFIYC